MTSPRSGTSAAGRALRLFPQERSTCGPRSRSGGVQRNRIADTTVATVDGAVAGFVMVVDDEVEQVYVSASHRGTGIAGLLMAEAEQQVRANGHPKAWLAVVEGNARADPSTNGPDGTTKGRSTMPPRSRPPPRAARSPCLAIATRKSCTQACAGLRELSAPTVNFAQAEAPARFRPKPRPGAARAAAEARRGIPPPSVTGAIVTRTSSSSPASANCPARSPPPTIQTFLPRAAATIASCTVATSALVSSIWPLERPAAVCA